MTINDLYAAAELIINESGYDKNTKGRIGSLFKAVIEKLSNSVAGSDGSVKKIYYKTAEEYQQLIDQNATEPETLYIVLDPEQTYSITQTINTIIDDLDSKADAQALAQSISGILNAIGSKANQQDLNSLAAILTTSVIQQYPDWMNIFTKNGPFVFVDDDHGINRPDGLYSPLNGEQRKYNILSFAINNDTLPTALMQDQYSEDIYVLHLNQGDFIVAIRLATSDELGAISSALISIQDLVTSIIG